MGGGAPLAFLNKKTWHPGRMQNLEEVWKREQQAEAEQRKLEELRKQYEDERKNAEFTQMAEEAGYKKDTRLDWMYAGSLAAKAAAAAGAQQQQQAEQPLMGKQPAPDEHLSRAERAAALPSLLAAATPASQNEAWARLNNDPLLAIKKQEQDALKRVRENPVKMQQILKEVEKVRGHKHKKDKKDKKEKKEKRDKKDRKRSRSHSHSRSRSASPPRHRPAAAAAMPPPPARDGRHHDSGYAGAGSSRGRSPPSRPAAAAAAMQAPHAQDSRHHDSAHAGGGSSRGRSPPSRPAAAAAAAAMQAPHARDSRRYDSGHAGGGSSRGRSPPGWGDRGGRDRGDYRSSRHERSRSRSRSRSRGRSQRHPQEQQQQQQSEQREHEQRRSSQQHGSGSRDRGNGDRDAGRHHSSSSHQHHHESHHHEPGKGAAAAAAATAGDDAAAADSRYGLKLAAGPRHAPLNPEQQAADAAARAAATRQRLAEAAAARDAETAAAAAASAQRRQRAEYKPGKLSAEEKAARLAAMMGDAAEHDRQRQERLHQARAAEADDQKGVAGLLAKAAAAKAEDAFKSAAAAEVFGSLAGGGMSLDARISSRRHYQER